MKYLISLSILLSGLFTPTPFAQDPTTSADSLAWIPQIEAGVLHQSELRKTRSLHFQVKEGYSFNYCMIFIIPEKGDTSGGRSTNKQFSEGIIDRLLAQEPGTKIQINQIQLGLPDGDFIYLPRIDARLEI